MTTRIAVCPGSFDPVTLGHLDIVRRARSLFDEVVVAVGINAGKAPLLDAETRVRLFTEAVAGQDGVRVVRMPGLLADLCTELGAAAIVKGLRGGADYDAEQPMALMNRHLSGVETVFVTGAPELAHVSSSMVKDVARYGGDIAGLVPPAVSDAVHAAISAPPPKDGRS
ncbi:pantetheine-phosphate adenylyltransferase [Ruania suaedae]|uniref:pantetheine-phosphate adenylyltransferase n=1 Tax=Ruania suaedae TaxID=2897774 RepID=UPI001E55D9C3|nr:pantetheine-phosphate adenylyltransferase [Ruania suaedae]UFU01976.1 pantetheine-phosphate adenylyltransferase [Ruania suaedae]